MADERKEDLKNVTLLTSKATGRNYHSNKHNKTLNEHEVVLQSVDNPSEVKTGIMDDSVPIPENGTVLERIIVYENNFKGKITQKFLIPTAQASGDSGGEKASGSSSWKGGRQEDVELKLVSFAMSYAKDLFAATPEAELQGMFDAADAIFKHMLQMYKTAKA